MEPSEPVNTNPSLSDAAIDEIGAHAQVESLRVIVKGHHHVGHIAAVFPKAQPAGGLARVGPCVSVIRCTPLNRWTNKSPATPLP